MPDEIDIAKLLRLKRHEQPPPQYFGNFLTEFQKRQRSELLRQPLWRIAWDRFQAFVGEHSLPRYAYAGATAAVLLFAGLVTKDILTTGDSGSIAQSSAARRPVARTESALAFDSHIRLPDLAHPSSQRAASATVSALQPRYVIDARPVSYEPSSSFDF